MLARFRLTPEALRPVGPPSHFLGPLVGAPKWEPLLSGVKGWAGRGGVEVSQGASLGASVGISFRVKWAPNMHEVFLGALGGGEIEVALHLIHGGALWVLHEDHPTLVALHTVNGAERHPRGVADVGLHSHDHEGVVGLPLPLGGGGRPLGGTV